MWLRGLSKRIYMWLLFVGLVAVLPPLATWIIGYTHSNSPTTTALLAEGDGFLIAIAIAADAIGRVTDDQRRINFSSFFCAMVLIAALIAFVTAKTEILNQKTIVESSLASRNCEGLIDTLKTPPNDEEHIAIESKWALGASLVTSFIIVLSQKSGAEEGSK